MRYSEWFKRVGGGNPGALDVGRKLLGYLSVRRQTPGVKTIVERVTLDDGTVVEAAFYGDLPRVIIRAPDGGEACELYVESGLLDLGPNIAPDAAQRFNRGPPQFDDSPATLFFGDGVQCVDGEPGLNGRVRIDSRSLASQCLPKQGDAIESRLTDPVKKQAQAMLPASCWSGLMQRYVQAVYGGDALDYRVVGDHLLVEDVDIGGLGKSVGMVEVSGKHYFVFASEIDVSWCRVKFKSRCAAAVYRAWAIAKANGEDNVADKLLTVALSAASPDADAMMTAATFAPVRFSSPYGWQFHDASAVVVGTNADRTHAQIRRIDFTPSDEGVSASESTIESALLPPSHWGPLVVWPDGSVVELADTQQYLTTEQAFDVPVSCHYSAGNLVVVRYSVESPALPIETQEGRECGDLSGADRNTLVTFPTALIPEPLNCNVHSTSSQPDDKVPPGLNGSSGIYYKLMMPCGLYAAAGGAVTWSNVALSDAIGMSFMSESDSTRTTVIRRDWQLVATSVRMADGSPYPTTSSVSETGATSTGGFAYSASAWTYELLVPGNLACGTISLNNGSGTRDCSSAFSSYCTPIPAWDLSPLSGATGPCFYDYNIDCEMLCADALFDKCSFSSLVGAVCHLVIPRGDSSAGVAVRLETAGVVPIIDSFYGDGWSEDTIHSICEHPLDGNCTGSATATCASPAGPIDIPFVLPSRLDGFYRAANRSNMLLPAENEVTSADRGMEPRMRATFNAISFQGADGYRPAVSRSGAYSPSDVEWTEPKERTTCPGWFEIIGVKPADEPIKVDTATGPSSLEQMVLSAPLYVFQQGYSFDFSASLLLSTIRHADPLSFGNSINMDRQTITGGYPTVNTPSFVGWA